MFSQVSIILYVNGSHAAITYDALDLAQGSHFFYPAKFPNFSLTFPWFPKSFPWFFLSFH